MLLELHIGSYVRIPLVRSVLGGACGCTDLPEVMLLKAAEDTVEEF